MTFEEAPNLPPFIADLFPFARKNYVLQNGIHAGKVIHFVDHGPPDGPAVVLFHGNPTWSFLWRKVIQALDGTGFRVLAPDLLGLGLSSKLKTIGEHTLDGHAEAMTEWLSALNVNQVIMSAQDWGGPIAAGVGARLPKQIAGFVISNTSILVPRRVKSTAFHKFSRMPIVSDLVFRGLSFPQRDLSKAQGDPASIQGDVSRAYRWPLAAYGDRIAPLAMARMVPASLDHPTVEALKRGQEWATSFKGPMRLVWGMRDPILGGAFKRHALTFPDATPLQTSAGHFLQEEVPQELADAIRSIQSETAS